jgi:hypothetical protein
MMEREGATNSRYGFCPDGNVAAFWGRSGDYLDAPGVYITEIISPADIKRKVIPALSESKYYALSLAYIPNPCDGP